LGVELAPLGHQGPEQIALMSVVVGNMHVDRIVVEATAIGLELGHEGDQKATVELLSAPSTARARTPGVDM